jgi:glycosyltransferase involved in cell wall biosynthesis
MKIRLSVVVITYNEERNIARCLESVTDVADEILVVDSYSADRTEEICRAMGVRFIQHTFHSHIDQKNWAITQARFPYILSLDADEALSERLKASIQAVKHNWQHDGYYFNRLTNYCGKWIRHTTWYPSRKLRLWDARRGRWGGVNPHDKFILDPDAQKSFLKGDLLHYSYYTIDEHLIQMDKFSTIHANSYYQMGIRTSVLQRVLHTCWRFMNDYFFRMGFLDGTPGYTISKIGAREVRLKYLKLRDLWKKGGDLTSTSPHN